MDRSSPRLINIMVIVLLVGLIGCTSKYRNSEIDYLNYLQAESLAKSFSKDSLPPYELVETIYNDLIEIREKYAIHRIYEIKRIAARKGVNAALTNAGLEYSFWNGKGVCQSGCIIKKYNHLKRIDGKFKVVWFGKTKRRYWEAMERGGLIPITSPNKRISFSSQ